MMKKSRFSLRRVLSALTLALYLVVPLGLPASAVSPDKEVGQPVPYYIGTFSTSASLSIDSSGKAACWGHVDCYRGYVADAVMRLQWKNENGVWIDYKSWYSEGTHVDFDETWNVPKGRTYRVKVVGDIFDEDGNWVEIVDVASGSEKY